MVLTLGIGVYTDEKARQVHEAELVAAAVGLLAGAAGGALRRRPWYALVLCPLLGAVALAVAFGIDWALHPDLHWVKTAQPVDGVTARRESLWECVSGAAMGGGIVGALLGVV